MNVKLENLVNKKIDLCHKILMLNSWEKYGPYLFFYHEYLDSLTTKEIKNILDSIIELLNELGYSDCLVDYIENKNYFKNYSILPTILYENKNSLNIVDKKIIIVQVYSISKTSRKFKLKTLQVKNKINTILKSELQMFITNMYLENVK